MEWQYDWEVAGRLPLQLELVMAIGAKGEEMRHVFWIPAKQNPEAVMRQFQGGGAGAGGGGAGGGDNAEEGDDSTPEVEVERPGGNRGNRSGGGGGGRGGRR
jgi:hypothetical protein